MNKSLLARILMKFVSLPILVFASYLIVEPVYASYDNNNNASISNAKAIQAKKDIATINFKVIHSQISEVLNNTQLSEQERAKFLNNLLYLQTNSLAREMNTYSSVARSLKASSAYLSKAQKYLISNSEDEDNVINKEHEQNLINNNLEQNTDSSSNTLNNNDENINVDGLSKLLTSDNGNEVNAQEQNHTSTEDKERLDKALGFNRSLASTTTKTLDSYTNDLRELIRSDLSETSSLEFSSNKENKTNCNDPFEELNLNNSATKELINVIDEALDKTSNKQETIVADADSQQVNGSDVKFELSSNSSLEDLNMSLSGNSVSAKSKTLSSTYDLTASIKESLKHENEAFVLGDINDSNNVEHKSIFHKIDDFVDEVYYSTDYINRRAEAQAYLDAQSIIAQRRYQYEIFQRDFTDIVEKEINESLKSFYVDEILDNKVDPCIIEDMQELHKASNILIAKKESNKEPDWITMSAFLRFNEIANAEPQDPKNYAEQGHSWSNSATVNGAFVTQAYEFNDKHPLSSSVLQARIGPANSYKYMKLAQQKPIVIDSHSVFSPESDKPVTDAVCIPDEVRTIALPELHKEDRLQEKPNPMISRSVDIVNSQLSITQPNKSLEGMYSVP